MRYGTLSYGNQFSFTCPIFNTETKMSSCVKLRDKVWRGEKPQVRKGCQACMAAGKCPAAVIVQRMAMSNPTKPVSDDYHSATPVKGKLRADVLERIYPVIVIDNILSSVQPSDAEISLIVSANKRIAEQLGRAPEPSAPRPQSASPKKRKAAKAPAKPSETVNKAAASGDMSAAINKEADNG